MDQFIIKWPGNDNDENESTKDENKITDIT